MKLLTEIEIKAKVLDIFETIRPYLNQDGGDIEYVKYVEYEDKINVLEVRMTGNCSDCPLAMMTLRAGIERAIIQEIPQIKRLEKVK